MNSDTLSLKTTISKLDFLKEIVITQWNIRKKILSLFATKFTEKSPNNPLYSETKKVKILWTKKVKIIKQAHAFKAIKFL